jgi:hypothetical protein
MSQNVEVIMTADTRQLLAEFDKDMKKIDQVIAKSKELGTEVEKSGKKMGDGVRSGADSAIAGVKNLLGAFGGIVTVAGGITAIASQLRAEYDNLVERQKTAADRQIDLAAAQRGAIFALGSDPKMTPAMLDQSLKGISKRTGVSEKQVTLAATDALSARGDRSAADALNAVEAAITLAPDDQQSATLFSGTALDFGKAFGADPKQALGFLLSIGQNSRVTNMGRLARNVAPGITGLTKFGDSAQQSGALMAAMTQGMVDFEGAVSRTTAIALAQQLETFMPEGKSTFERIQALQADPAKAAAFMKDASFERQAFPVVRELLAGGADSPMRKAYAGALGSVLTPQAAGGLYDSTIGDINALPVQQNARLNRLLQSSTERIQTEDIIGAQGSISREGLKSILKAVGTSALSQSLSLGEFEVASGGGNFGQVEAVERRLRVQAASLAAPRFRSSGTSIDPYGADSFAEDVPASAEDLNAARQLSEIANLLKLMLEESKSAKAKPQPVEIRNQPVQPPAPRPSQARSR